MRKTFVVILAVCLQGCQSLGGLSGTRDLPEDHFQEAWSLYRRCSLEQDAQEALGFADQLSRAALINEGRFVLVPDMMVPLIEPLPVRLAVEPKAMAAACALHAGHLALQAGQSDRAHRLFSLVVRRFHEPSYVFFVNEARAGLELVDRETSNSGAIPVGLR
jgi:hypothetical protein